MWFKHGRPAGDYPIKDLEVFKTKWWSWWKELQPSERLLGDELQRVDDELDWKSLAKKGDNGFLVVMLGLAWWGACAHVSGAEGNIEDWSRAVDDVKWTIENISVCTSRTVGGKKRVADSVSESSGRVSKKR